MRNLGTLKKLYSAGNLVAFDRKLLSVFVLQVHQFSPVSIIPPSLYTPLHPPMLVLVFISLLFLSAGQAGETREP